jgi:hypothetical protein
LLAALGALIAFLLTTAIPALEDSDLAWLAPTLAVALNTLRKWATDTQKKYPGGGGQIDV